MMIIYINQPWIVQVSQSRNTYVNDLLAIVMCTKDLKSYAVIYSIVIPNNLVCFTKLSQTPISGTVSNLS